MGKKEERTPVGREGLDAFILDLDGVVTDTARIHAAAWKLTFDDYLRERARRYGEDFVPFDADKDYLAYVNGKPRYDGVRDFLASRRITLPYGDPSDPSEKETVCGIGNRKNANFLRWLEEHGADPYPSTVAFVRGLRSRGVKMALISASRNARKVLRAAGISGLFDTVVDGVDAFELGLPGKPAPDMLVEAAQRLGARPERAAVIEDALAGVEAGRAGGFALVVGVDRGGQRNELREHGADVVVGDLSELAEEEEEQRSGLPSALASTDEIFRRLHEGVTAIFLDYDGTLTPIVREPSKAIMSEDMRNIIRELSEECLVSIISGRDLEWVRGVVDLDGLIYVGSHGYDMAGPSDLFSDRTRGTAFLPALDAAEAELRSAVGAIKGALVERKRFAIAVHYRNVDPRDVPCLEERFDAVASKHGDLSKMGGKMIFELRPHTEWDKGKAVLYLLDKFHIDGAHVVPLYIGDDVTDEDAFRALDGQGISVLVGDTAQGTAADYALRDVGEVREFLGALVDMFERETSAGVWSLAYKGFRAEDEGLREALCAVGNGYFATRGAAPESPADDIHYPGTYLAGTYNRLRSEVHGHILENESMVNIPNWLPFTFSVGGERFDPGRVDIHEYRQVLDMRRGILTRTMRFTDRRGRRTLLDQRRFVSMADHHLAGLETTIVPENWSGTLRLISALDGRVENSNVRRYRQLRSRHLEPVGTGSSGELMWLQAETNQSHIRISEAARTRVFRDGEEVVTPRAAVEERGYIAQVLEVEAQEGRPVRAEKIAALYSSKDRAVSEGLVEATNDLDHAGDFSTLAQEHVQVWDRLWERCHVDAEADHAVISQILNLHIFHLLQTVSAHSADQDVGVPPRGLHGEAYRGLIMWDEVFVLPFLSFRIPHLVRALLLYRYRRLPRARLAARRAGYDGAMFPWQSGSDGREEAQTMHLNPMSGRWIPDNSYLERHISLAVAYNVWQYCQITSDLDFLRFYGVELLVEIARFWASKARFNESRGRYEILGVMGPDEFHERYPGAERAGIDNNAYTNVMAVWVLCRAAEALEHLPAECRREVMARLSLGEEELERWDDISRRMVVPFHGDGIISQFEGYDDLQELDWDELRRTSGDIHRLDRVLEARGDSPDRYKISKQADVLMLFYLLSADELGELFDRLGYRLERDTISRTVDYYMKRTSHGSTLSRVVHAWVLARSNRDLSWSLFLEALRSDVSDIQGGTTHEGIHLGAMAGTVDIVQRCYTGLEVRNGVLWFEPRLPMGLKRLHFDIEYRRHRIEVDIGKNILRLFSRPQEVAPVQVGFQGAVRELVPGEALEFPLDRDAPDRTAPPEQ